MTNEIGRPVRRRNIRAADNDRLIREAAIQELNRVGVDQLSLREVAHVAGLTHGATYARFEDVEELLIDLWHSALRERLIALFELSIAAVQEPSVVSVGALFERLRVADARDTAAIELLLTSRRMPNVREECALFVQNYLEPDESLTLRSEALFSRAVLLFGVTAGRLFANAMFGAEDDYHDALEKLILEILSIDVADVPEWGSHAQELLARFEMSDRDSFPRGDSLGAEIARSAYSVVGKSGYVRATISRIARRAQCSPGAIYKINDSKEGLVIHAFRDIIGARWMKALDVADVLDDDYLTALLRAEASDRNELRRNFLLEMIIAARHNDVLRQTLRQHIEGLENGVSSNIGADDEMRRRLRFLVRTITTFIIAASWLPTITGSAKFLDFSQLGEPTKRAIREHWVPEWDVTSRELRHLPKVALLVEESRDAGAGLFSKTRIVDLGGA
ncbi:MAG TPA: TetR family transcriptional regulator [Acidimicrobiales bacterium]|jgi:AcrR family transcriptional regulator